MTTAYRNRRAKAPSLEVDLSALSSPDATPPHFYPLFADRKRNLVLVGGAGSGKSNFAAMKCVVRAMRRPGHHICIFRKVLRTCRVSVYTEIQRAIERTGTGDHWSTNKSDLTFEFVNGSVIRCLGLDDVEKLKSIVGMTSAWIEEATEVSPGDYAQVNLRLRGETPSYKQIMLTCNPISIYSWVKERFFDTPQHGQSTTHHSTYLDNPFLDAEYRDVLEGLTDPALHMVYAKGEWGVIGNLVYGSFPNGDWAIPNGGPDETWYGLDFGYQNPTALVRLDMVDRTVYVTELLYESHLTHDDLMHRMGEIGVSKHAPMYPDSAEPARIEALAVAGYNVKHADKGPGSVLAGISLVKAWDVRTCPDNVNLNSEAAHYKWAETRDGKPVQPEKPVPWDDHLMDALRYAMFTHLRDRVDTSPQRFVYDAVADGGGGSMIRRLG